MTTDTAVWVRETDRAFFDASKDAQPGLLIDYLLLSCRFIIDLDISNLNNTHLFWLKLESLVSISGDYMQVKVHSVVAIAGMVVSMTTPAFSMTTPLCLTFDYEVKAFGDTPILEIHIRMTNYMLSGDVIWTSKDYNRQRDKARITLSAARDLGNSQYMLDFVGIVAEPVSTLIRVANVGVSDGQCENEQTSFHSNGNSGIVHYLNFNQLETSLKV